MTNNPSVTMANFPLSPSKPLKKTISKIIPLFISLLSLVITLAYPIYLIFNAKNGKVMNIPILIVVFIVLYLISLVIEYVYQYMYYKNYFYECTDDFIIIRKGVLSTREITMPYSRIQDVYVDQDIWDRMFGLYDVHLSTATVSSGYEAHIDGVLENGAQGLREQILQKIKNTHPATQPLPTPAAPLQTK